MEDFEVNKRVFKGIWFPKEIWFDKRLSALDKFILMEIDSLDSEEDGYCYASNEYLADFCQCGVRKVTDAISKLIKYGYIEQVGFDGRKRYLHSRLAFNTEQTSKKCVAETQKMPERNIIENTNIETIVENNTKNIKKESNDLFSVVVEDDEFNDTMNIFNYWNTKDIIKHREINNDIEKAIKKALKEHTVAEIKLAIDRYAYVYHDENYYFKHKWSLDQFLKQGNAYKDFLDNGSKWENYVNSKAGQKAVENIIISEYYDPHFLDNIDMEKVERELSK